MRRNEANGNEVEGSSRSNGHRIRPLAQSLAGWATLTPLREEVAIDKDVPGILDGNK